MDDVEVEEVWERLKQDPGSVLIDDVPRAGLTVKMIRGSLSPARLWTFRPMRSATPVVLSPALRMNIAQTVMTALLLKPWNACEESTRPVTASAPRTRRATRSMRMTSLIKSTNEMARMPRTIAISRVIQSIF